MIASFLFFIKPTIYDILKINNRIYANERHIKAALDWLCLAQDMTKDGGVSAYFSLLGGWAPTFIETTGYIIPTLIGAYSKYHKNEYIRRAIKMGDFLTKMQLPDGAFRTRTPAEDEYALPDIFDTSQDVLGLSYLYRYKKEKKYLEAVRKACDFIIRNQEKDGSFIKYSLGGIPHSYYSRVAYALVKAYGITKNDEYIKAAENNLNWVISQQNENGWFEKNNFPGFDSNTPFTHTISYAMEGLLFSGLELNNKRYIESATRTANSILSFFTHENFMPATFDPEFKSRDRYSCLTGSSQISLVWSTLYKYHKDKKYLLASSKLNNYLKSCQHIGRFPSPTSGGIKGSNPIYGDVVRNRGYCRMSYLNWATKFFIDALLFSENNGNHMQKK